MNINKISLKSAFLAAIVAVSIAPGSSNAAVSSVPLKHANINLSDRASLQNGAKLFVNYCLSCHSAELMRYERLTQDLGISETIVRENMMFTSEKIGSRMEATMSDKDGKAWFGRTPPDLSVISRARGSDYLYTYLISFYKDPTTVSGWNNAVLKNAAMPHVMHDLQGTQVLAHHDEAKSEGEGHEGDGHAEASMFELVTPGSMSPLEFDTAMRDLTNYLAYMAEPAGLKRVKIGFWVLSFLSILLALTWFLKKDYWRDVYGDDPHH